MVIIADGPFTPRSGRSDSRSIPTPSKPHPTMVTAKAVTSTPTSGHPLSRVDWPVMPNASSTYIATNDPTMNTLKWEKLISSMIP